MHGNETPRNAISAARAAEPNEISQISDDVNHRAQFTPARDSRNRRVRGLYVRNGRYYCQLWTDLGNGKKGPRRFPLVDGDNQPVRSLAAAREALEIKRHERRENKLPTLGRKPLFADYCEVYFQKAKVQRKRPGTVENERQATGRWRDFLGHVRIDRIATPAITAYIDKRLKGGVFCGRKLAPVSERTVNIDLMALRNVLKASIDDGHLRELPRIKLLDEAPPPKRQLITPVEFNNLIKAARRACAKNGEQLADYLQFLAFTGAREKEALRVRWEDVDFRNER